MGLIPFNYAVSGTPPSSDPTDMTADSVSAAPAQLSKQGPGESTLGQSNGTKIIFAGNSPTTGVNIYTVTADGSGLFQVTHDGAYDDPIRGTHEPSSSA
jgi:hypothetical protein